MFNSTYKKQRTRYEKNFDLRKLVGVFISILLLFMLILWHDWVRKCILGLIVSMGKDPGQVTDRLRSEEEFVGTAVWTLTTILSAFVILYYEALGNRNYGLTNRKIIAYTCGTAFIPLLVGINSFFVFVMTCMYYVNSCTNFYLIAGYSCLLQAFLIITCVWSSTRRAAFNAIIKVERGQLKDFYEKIVTASSTGFGEEEEYCEIKEIIENGRECPDKGEGTKLDLIHSKRREYIEKEKGKIIYHLDHLLQWDEPFSEKRGMVKEILELPSQISFFYPGILYEYQLRNFQILTSFLKNRQVDNADIEDTSESIRVNEVLIECLYQMTKVCKEEELICIWKVCEYFGAFFNVLIPESILRDRWNIIKYILNEVVNNQKLQYILIKEFLISIQYNQVTDRLSEQNTEDMEEMVKCVREINGFQNAFFELADIFESGEDSLDMRFYTEMILSWLDGVTENRMYRYCLLYKIQMSFVGRQSQGYCDYINYLRWYC